MAINVPEGDWFVDAYSWTGTGYRLVGTTAITVFVDSMNISNIYSGIEDGIK